MLNTHTTSFSTPLRRGSAIEIARDEPSHIHIPRPSLSRGSADKPLVDPGRSRPTFLSHIAPAAEQQARSEAEADLQLAGKAR